MLDTAGGILLAVAILVVGAFALYNWRLVGVLACAAGLIALIVHNL